MKKPHANQNPEIKKQKPLTIFHTVILKLSLGSNPFFKNFDRSPLFPWEPNWPDPDHLWSEPPPPRFRVSSRKSAVMPPLLKPLNGFLAELNLIFHWNREEEIRMTLKWAKDPIVGYRILPSSLGAGTNGDQICLSLFWVLIMQALVLDRKSVV